ncbi:hypothetical protein CLAIMM_14190 [Cladophialophora immunda]|nr:hypothetical protein CLAIMM_14190 [Cladophialophora immunda]
MDPSSYSPLSFGFPTAADDFFAPFDCFAAQDQLPNQAFYESPLSIRDAPSSSPPPNESIIDKVVMRIVPNPQNGFSLYTGDTYRPMIFTSPPMIDQVVMNLRRPSPPPKQLDQSPGLRFSNCFAPDPEWQSRINPTHPVGDHTTTKPASHAAGDKRRSTCPTCGMSYGRREDMLRHLRAHSKNTKFACGFCPKTFRRREVWREHQDWCRNRSRASMPKRGKMARCIACAERDVDCSLGTPCFNCATLGEECSRRFGNRASGNASGPGPAPSWSTSPDEMFLGHEQASFPTSILWSPPPTDPSRGQPQSRIHSALFQNYSRRFEGPMRWWIARLSSLPYPDPASTVSGDGQAPSPPEVKPPSLMEMAQRLDADLISWHQESAWTVLKTAIAAFGSQGIDPRSGRWEPKYGHDNGCRPEFWVKAKASIDKSPDILSFQVILANLILGMIHSPAPEYDESFAAEAPSGISFPRQDSRKVGNRFIRRGISDLFQLMRQVKDTPATGFVATAAGQQYLRSFFSLGLLLDTISSAVDAGRC